MFNYFRKGTSDAAFTISIFVRSNAQVQVL